MQVIDEMVNPLELRGWDGLISAQPHGSFFHGACWARVLAKTYNFSPAYFLSRSGAALQSLLPVMEVSSWLTGRRGVALPFTDDCVPIASDPVSFRRLFDKAIEFGERRGWRYLECRGGHHLLPGIAPSVSYYGHCLRVVLDEQYMFSRFDSSVRRAIRKSEKARVKVSIASDLAAIEVFYSLQCKTRRKHGLPPQPFNFFRNICDSVLKPGFGVIVIAWLEKQPVAASVIFRLGHQAIFKYGASDDRFQNLRGTNLVMWEAIKWCAREGIRTFHLGRTSAANEGLRRFKLGWRADEEEIAYFKYDLRRRQFITDSDGAFGWHNRFFRVMPSFVSRGIGSFLYQHCA